MVSYNPYDIRDKYCGNCHLFEGERRLFFKAADGRLFECPIDIGLPKTMDEFQRQLLELAHRMEEERGRPT